MVCAFEQGRLADEIGGDGHGVTADQAAALARDLRDERPDAVVAILRAKRSWNGGWPWTKTY